MKKYKGLLTVEAALVLPLYTCAVLALCFIFRLMILETKVQSAISRAAEDVASYGYVLNMAEAFADEKKEELLANIPLGNTVFSFLSDYAEDYALKLIVSGYIDTAVFEQTRVEGGFRGVSFKGSSVRDKDNCTSIRVKYYVDIPFVGRLIPDIEVNQSAAASIFSGKIVTHKDPEEENDPTMVYITKNASVYHTHADCTHLMLTVNEVSKEELPNRRSRDGHKYYPCEYCMRKKTVPDTVLISPEGDRYHSRKDCIGLRRYVTEVELDSINLPLCSRCGARDKKEEEEP